MGGKKDTGEGQRQALYRKYRSRSLDEVVGQEHITTTLAKAVAAGKISHAYLFTGPRGTGKTSVARILAHEINKLPYADDSTHLDIIEIDAASNRRIDDVRDLRDKVHIAPISSPYKVYIIDEVHMLTMESFNALLKTLEEPPRHVIFILATTEMHKLPATIVSRTQRHSFRFIPQEKIVAHLAHIAKEEGIKIDPEALALIAEHGGGSFRDSISLLDQMGTIGEEITVEAVASLLGLAPSAQITSLLTAIESHDIKLVLETINTILSNGVTPVAFAHQLIPHIRTQLLEDPKQRYIELMHDLIGVSTSHYPRMKLETTLLSHALDAESTTTAPPPTRAAAATPSPSLSATLPPRAQPEEIPPKQKQPAQQAPKSTPKVSESQQLKSGKHQDILEKWPQILEAIRIANNPLYTVLRLATPRLNNQDLELIFQFPFHQKRVDDAKYKSLLGTTINEIVGVETSIICLVDKATKEAEKNTAHASHLATVQDIMGGGEIIHD